MVLAGRVGSGDFDGQGAKALGQRGWNLQPGGGASALAISPRIMSSGGR